MGALNSFFKVNEHKSTVGTEVLAGITTFAAMSYIIFLQPDILSGKLINSSTGMSSEALFTATCIVAAFSSILMGLLANYPVALAPGMGENFFFVTMVTVSLAGITGLAPGSPELWQAGLSIVFISGLIFAILSFLNIRQLLMKAVSGSMRNAILVGIGLFIAQLGLVNGRIVKVVYGHFKLSPDIQSYGALVFVVGLITAAVLEYRRVKGGLLIGIGAAMVVALITGQTTFAGVCSMPPSVAPVICKFNFSLVMQHFFKILPLIIIFVYMDVFDTLGCLLGLAGQAKMITPEGQLPRAKRAFASDAIGTIAGSMFGNSTVTTYLESGTGIEAGGRTGLTAVVTGICFIIALFFSPLVSTAAGFPPITAPAMVIVGVIMMTGVKSVLWDDLSEALPSFLVIVGIPFTGSIADGMMLGFIVYPLMKLLCGKAKDVDVVSYVIAILMLLYLLLVK